MVESKYNLGRVSKLSATAIGDPGARRFHIFLESLNGNSATLWLEKDSLFNLAVNLKRIITTIDEGLGGQDVADAVTGNEEVSDIEVGPINIDVGRLSVGYDRQANLYVIAAHSVEQIDFDIPTLSFTASHEEISSFTDESLEVCAAGRPLCPLCSAPMGKENHICPKHNGHVTTEL